MTYLKAMIMTVGLLICLLIAFMFLTFDANSGLHEALDAFLKNDYAKAKKELQKLESSLPQAEFLLYQAYLERGLRHWQTSDHILQEAAGIARKSHPALLFEITLNQALNAYQENNVTALSQAVDLAKNHFSEEPWTSFFIGLEFFERGLFDEALKQWSTIPPADSPWMNKGFSLFTPLWLELKKIRCNINQGTFLALRERLLEIHASAPPEHTTEIDLLLGLTYMKEAEEKPIGAVGSYYRLAASYFHRIPVSDPQFKKEKAPIISQMQEDYLELISQNQLTDPSFYLALLEHWNAKPEKQEIEHFLFMINH